VSSQSSANLIGSFWQRIYSALAYIVYMMLTVVMKALCSVSFKTNHSKLIWLPTALHANVLSLCRRNFFPCGLPNPDLWLDNL